MCPKRVRDPEDDFHLRLDHEGRRLAKEHKFLLSAAAFEHERIREQAQVVQEQWRLQMELEREEREEAARQALQQKSEELVRRRIVSGQKQAQEALALQQLEAEALQAQARAQQEAARALEIKQAPPPATRAPTPPKPKEPSPKPPETIPAVQVHQKPPQPAAVRNDSTLQIHQRYLQVHQNLKALRKTIRQLPHSPLKDKIGNLRREITKSVGQLTINMSSNTAPYNKIRSTLNEASTLQQQPQVDLTPYLAADMPPELASSPVTIGLAQIYLLHFFAKAVISQFVTEAGVSPKAAEPIGTVAIRIFAANDFKWQGISLMDILLAKFHAVCPVLFGMYPKGPSAKKQKQGEALTGLGAGFAALSLRDFGKSTITNPFPPSNFWQAVARITNTPPSDTTQAHSIVLKAMIENHAAKFIKFFGQAAIAALRKAVVDFPKHAPKSVASSALATLQTTLRRDVHLTL